MIEEFDKLAITSDNYNKLSEEERKSRVKKREQLLAKMTKEELQILLKRPYPGQMKEKIRKNL